MDQNGRLFRLCPSRPNFRATREPAVFLQSRIQQQLTGCVVRCSANRGCQRSQAKSRGRSNCLILRWLAVQALAQTVVESSTFPPRLRGQKEKGTTKCAFTGRLAGFPHFGKSQSVVCHFVKLRFPFSPRISRFWWSWNSNWSCFRCPRIWIRSRRPSCSWSCGSP